MKWFVALLFLLPQLLSAQHTLVIVTSPQSEIVARILYKKSFTSKAEREREVKNFLLALHDNAFLAAAIDSSVTDSLRQTIYISTGSQYEWALLRRGNVDESLLGELNSTLLRRGAVGKAFHYKEVRTLQEKILRWCENNGYPFASIALDSVLIEGSRISAALNLQKNLLVKIDSVVNRGTAKIAPVYLQSYLGIRNGSLYNETAVKKAGTHIRELGFVREKFPARVIFPGENAKLELFLEKKRASQFDGILGMLPDNRTGKILFTGDVRLRLINSFNRGELLDLNWRRLQAATQDLKSRFVFPFLFKSPFGLDASFKLYKKDSTYLEVNPNLGIQYHLSGGNYFKAFANRRQLTLLSTSGLQNLTILPPYADITSVLYGLSARSEKLDYRFNPRKGFSFTGTVSAGNKTIKKNSAIDENVYSNLKLKSAQYSAELEAELFLPLKNRSAIKFGNQSGGLFSENIFQNELFRLGGLRTLRGFDDESIPASAYSVFTLEYRFLFEENSYLFLFGDGAYYENSSVTFSGDRYDTPFGFGAGISFETKAGIFSINYALGSQLGNPVDLRAGKIHFGIVNYF